MFYELAKFSSPVLRFIRFSIICIVATHMSACFYIFLAKVTVACNEIDEDEKFNNWMIE